MYSRPRRTRAPRLIARAVLETLEDRTFFARFGIIGDMGAGSIESQIASMIKGWNPMAILTVGDNDNINNTRYEDTVGQYFHDWISPYNGDWGDGSSSGNKFWPAMGNHDWDSSTGSAKYTAYFTLPGNERYYSKKLDNVEFFMYDSDTREPDGTSASSTQGNWLRNAMAASTAKWKIVILHHAPYTSGGEPDGTWVRLPFEDWGADVVLSGHQHKYERLSVDGFPYIVNARAGATTGGWGSIDSRSVVRYSDEDGALRVDSSDTELTIAFYNRFGTKIDSITLDAPASPPPPPPPPPPPAGTTSLVASGSSWKYLDNGSNQGTSWRGTSFSDSSWKTGNSQLGYGEGDEATVVGYGSSSSNKYVTTYFRKSFSVSSPSSFSSLNLSLLRDDGAVVYLNGTEIYRNNMPSGTPAYNTLASTTIDSGEQNWLNASLGTSLLQSGNNVIAVEIHQSVVTSSDLSFNFTLNGVNSTSGTAPSAPSALGVSAVSSSQINLSWTDNSSSETGFRIERSEGGQSNFVEIATVGANVKTYSSTGLSPSTLYYYRVRAYNSAGNSGYTNYAGTTTQSGSGGGGSTVYLSDLNWVSATNGYGPVEKDTGNGGSAAGDGATIKLNGVTYSKGLGAHANSEIIYDLNGAYATFISDIGVDDRQTTNGSIIFKVYVDGTKVYDSGVMGATTATKTVNVSVAGADQLRLVINDSGNGTEYDHGDWAGARLVTASSSSASAFSTAQITTASTTLLTSDIKRDPLELLL